MADLQELITDKKQEGKSIEYKREMYRLDSPDPKDKDKQREELLKDVSSFANTIGGHLIIGMDEESSIPTAVPGVPLQDHEKEILRLHQLIEQWLEPRISCGIHAVETGPGKYVLVIHVPQSLVSPHRVVHQNRFGQFWARNSKGAYAMDTSELRRAFILSETIYEQMKTFRRDRVHLIMDADTPVLTGKNAKAILHLLPLESFSARVAFDVKTLQQMATSLYPPTISTPNSRLNIDGLVMYGGGRSLKDEQVAYTQLFRNGVIEAVLSDIAGTRQQAVLSDIAGTRQQSGNLFLCTYSIENGYRTAVPRYLQCLKKLGVHAPVWCFMTLTGVRGVTIKHPNGGFQMPIDRDVLLLPETLIDDLAIDTLPILKELFDMIWNAGGQEGSCHFDAQEKWIGR
jgi:hypothetical protein